MGCLAPPTTAGHLLALFELLPGAGMLTQVVRASTLLSLTLGSLLGVLLAAGSASIPALFTADPQVRVSIRPIEH